MRKLDFIKNGIYLSFTIDDSGLISVEHIGLSDKECAPNRFFTPLEVFASGVNPDAHHALKHVGSTLSLLRYVSHEENDDQIIFTLENNTVKVILHYEFLRGVKSVRSHAEIFNISDEAIGLEYASSFCLYGFDLNKIWLCHNAWCREFEWHCHAPNELGYNHLSGDSTKRIAVSSTGTWSTKEYLPIGIIENPDECIFWQIEHNGSWNFEISDVAGVNYLKLSGPSEQENGWYKELKPAECFKTVKAAVCFAPNFNAAIAEMNSYRKSIAKRSPADEYLPVIFNDYMGCLGADPTTEKEIPVIDAAAAVGAEIFCMDAGWYADGTWWETVGEWKIVERRFPGGMKKVFDYIRSKGMKPGIWLEPEVMGINCPILDSFTDDCFFMRHGKRVIDHGRYHFDFRNKKVTDFLDNVVDSLIRDYGIEYFKFDYNIEGGVGTEVNADSFGDGLFSHQQAYLNWIDSIYERHPNLIIENCASGGMRMDYSSLSHFSMQSLSDASRYKVTASIAAMSASAVIPEQAQVWVTPYTNETNDEIALGMASAVFRRPVISGQTHLLNNSQLKVLKEGIDFHKSVRAEISSLVPFYPCGVTHFNDPFMVYGYKASEYDYIIVESFSDEEITINFDTEYKTAVPVYPVAFSGSVSLNKKNAKIKLPENSAIILKLTK